ncbi:TPA: hypothetical protein ACH3X3_001030 [Trebouxia sp. C0006]
MSDEASDDEMHEADLSSPKATENGDAVQYGELNVSSMDSVAVGVAAGNIHLQSANAATLALPEGSREAREQQERLLEAVEERRALRETTVPTSDADVRAALRAIKEPVTLFGEQQMERRARLRKIMATMDDEDERKAALPGGAFEEEYEEAAPPKKELFYTEGSALLKQARLHIAHFSLDRAAARLAGAKRKRESPDEDEIAEQADTIRLMRKVTNQSSEIADDRPSAACEFSPDGSTLATGAWSGLLKLWSVPDCQKKLTIKAHDDRVTGIAWHPSPSQTPGTVQLVTGSADKTARLFSGEGKQLGSLQAALCCELQPTVSSAFRGMERGWGGWGSTPWAAMWALPALMRRGGCGMWSPALACWSKRDTAGLCILLPSIQMDLWQPRAALMP